MGYMLIKGANSWVTSYKMRYLFLGVTLGRPVSDIILFNHLAIKNIFFCKSSA